MRPAAALLVLARAPLPGKAKSRLVPRLGAWGAARLQARLTRRTLRTAHEARCGPLELHGAPRARQAFFLREARRFGATLHAQRGADLGARMLHALSGALRRHRAAILIGTDCPALRAADLRRATRALAAGHDAVIAPAEDGGYALIGVRRVVPRLFENIAWGEAQVFAQTRLRLESLGWRWKRLRTVWDVDRPEDLERLRRASLRARRSI